MKLSEWYSTEQGKKTAAAIGVKAPGATSAKKGMTLKEFYESDEGQNALRRRNMYATLYNAHAAEDTESGTLSRATHSLAKKVLTPSQNVFEPSYPLAAMKTATASDLAGRQAEEYRKAEAEKEREADSFTTAQNGGVLKRERFDALEPMRDTMETVERGLEKKKQIEALKAAPTYVSDGTDVNGRRRVKYNMPDYGKMTELQNEIDAERDAMIHELIVNASKKDTERDKYIAEGKAKAEYGILSGVDNENVRDALKGAGEIAEKAGDVFNIAAGGGVGGVISNTLKLREAIEERTGKALTDEELDTYYYWLGRNEGQAEKYLEFIKEETNARAAEKETAAAKEFAKEHPVAGTALNVASSLVSPLALGENFMASLRGKEYDANSPWSIGARVSSATAEGLTGDIKNPVGKFFADLGLGTLNFAAHLPFGGAALPMMALEAGGQASYSARMDGASTNDAAALGFVSALTEYVLEKAPLDEIFTAFSKGGLDDATRQIYAKKLSEGLWKDAKSILSKEVRGNILKSTLSEGSEELLSEYINTIADTVIRADRSELIKYRDELMAQGVSEHEANVQTALKYLALEPFLAFAGGALSGAGLSSAGHIMNIPRNIRDINYGRLMEAKLTEEKAAAEESSFTKDPATAAIIAEMDTEEAERRDIRPVSRTALNPITEAPKVRAKDFLERSGMLLTADQEYNRMKADSAKTETARTGYLSGATESDIYIAETLSNVTGREILFVGDDYAANGEFDGDNTILINPKRSNVLSQVIAHELVHSVEGTKAYTSVVKAVKSFVDTYSQTGAVADWDTLYGEIMADYEKKYTELTGKKFDDVKAEKEVVARVMESFFGEGNNTAERQAELTTFIVEFAKSDRNGATRMWYRLTQIAKRISEDIAELAKKAVLGKDYDSAYREHQLMLRRIEDIRDKFGRALMEAKRNSTKGERAFMMSDTFASDIENWEREGRPRGESFVLGSTGDVLQGLGAIESDIYMNGDKINTILSEHPEMTLDEIKKLPQILENPVLILKSRGIKRGGRNNTRLIIFGTIKAKDGRPVLSVLDLRPQENNLVVDDMQKVVSAYTKDNSPIEYVKNSDVLYTSENKKITTRLLRSIGFQMPIELNRSGYIGSISYNGRFVNISGEKFSDVFSVKNKAVPLLGELDTGKSLSISASNTTPQNDFETEMHAKALSLYAQMRKAQKSQTLTDITKESIYEQTGWYYDYFGNFVIDREAPVYVNEKTPSEKHRNVLEAQNTELRAENISLSEDAAKWKARAEAAEKAARIIERDAEARIKADRQRSPEYMPSAKQVGGIVGELCDMFGGGYTSKQKSEFTARLLDIYDSIGTNVRYASELTSYSSDIAALISDMQDVRLKNSDNYEIAKTLRGELKTPLYLSERARGDISGGYGAAVRKYRGKVNLTTKERGTPVDVRYAELSEAHPEWFPADIENEADQLNRILEVSDRISDRDFATRDRYSNVDADPGTVRDADLSKALVRILDGYNELETVPRTFADGLLRQLEFNSREHKRELERATEEERERLTKQHEAEMERLMREAEAAMEWETGYLNREISRIFTESESERKAHEEKRLADEMYYGRKLAVEKRISKGRLLRQQQQFEDREEARRQKKEAAEKAKAEAARRRAHARGEDIQDAAIEAARDDNSFTKKMMPVYERLEAMENELAKINAKLAKYKNAEKLNLRGSELLYIKDLKARHAELTEDKSNLEAYINKVNTRVKDIRFKMMCDMIAKDGYFDGWNDKAAPLWYAVETMRRNVRDIAPKNRESKLADYIIKEILDPVTSATYMTTVVRNQERERVKALGLATKPHKGDVLSESQFVQAYGEAMDNIKALDNLFGSFIYNKHGEPMREGMTADEWRGYLNRIIEENPSITKDKAKFEHMKASVEVFKDIYDKLFTMVNGARVRNGYAPVPYHRGYFPHYNNDTKQDNIFSLMLKGFGFRQQEISEKLPTSINGLTATFRPGIRYMSNAKQRSMAGFAGDRRVTGAVEGLDRYIEVATDVAFQTDNIQNLRALSNAIRYATTSDETQKRIKEIKADDSLSHDQKQERINEIFASKTDKTKYALNNFVVELEEYTNQLAGKKSNRDREAERLFGRSLYTMARRASGNVAANAIVGNIGSALTNVIPLMDGGAVMHYHMLGAMWDMARAAVHGDGFAATSQFLTNRRGSERLIKSGTDKASDVGGIAMNFVDNFTSELLMRARVRQNQSKHRGSMSYQAAMAEADTFISGMMGDRSKGAMPTIFGSSNPIIKAFTMYQLEVKNQFGFMLKDMPRDSDKLEFVMKLMAMAILHRLFNDVYEKLTGRRPALDPLEMINDLSGDLIGWEFESVDELFDGDGSVLNKTERKNAVSAVLDFLGNVGKETPFIGGMFFDGGRVPISSMLFDGAALRAALEGIADGDDPKNIGKNLYKGISPVLYYGAMPLAGGVVKKTVEGIDAYAKGGSYNYNAKGERKMQYPIFTDEGAASVGRAVKSVLFGKTSTEGGQAWIEGGFGELSVKQTACYEDMVKAGEGQREAWELINTLRETNPETDKNAARIDVLLSSSVIDEAKEVAFLTFVGTSETMPGIMKELRSARVDIDDFLKIYKTKLLASGEVKEQVLEAIDKLNISKEKKDVLYLCWYSENSLYNAPWNTKVRRLEAPEIGVPKIPKITLSKIGG